MKPTSPVQPGPGSSSDNAGTNRNSASSRSSCSSCATWNRSPVVRAPEKKVDGRGQPASASFYRSLIRSDVRIDYDQLDEIFAGRTAAPAAVAEPIAISREAAAGLAERRSDTALEVVSSEPEFSFDEEGNVVGAGTIEQTESHRLRSMAASPRS